MYSNTTHDQFFYFFFNIDRLIFFYSFRTNHITYHNCIEYSLTINYIKLCLIYNFKHRLRSESVIKRYKHE